MEEKNAGDVTIIIKFVDPETDEATIKEEIRDATSKIKAIDTANGVIA